MQLMESVPVSEMNRRSKEVLAMLKNGPIALFQRSEPAAVMVLPSVWNNMVKELEDLRDVLAAYKAEIEIWEGRAKVVDLDLDEMKAELDNASISA
ncbi:type II toxin-antitoxin system Phd/YefM family antitoxin [Chloroflexi bacterium TSY]|nr:type II toxin-antitoxin system Phd/YefM family antitoxin [Chloroflexi bacterium TSY]